jgi:hypothetical protein
MPAPDNSQVALVGPGRFQWNLGGWFGSSIGSTAWMLIVAAFLYVHGQSVLALVPGMAFLIVNAVTVVQWRRRCRLLPFRALMTLLVLLSVVTSVVLLAIERFASPVALAAMHWVESGAGLIPYLLIGPVLIVLFVLLERSSVTKAEGLNQQ